MDVLGCGPPRPEGLGSCPRCPFSVPASPTACRAEPPSEGGTRSSLGVPAVGKDKTRPRKPEPFHGKIPEGTTWDKPARDPAARHTRRGPLASSPVKEPEFQIFIAEMLSAPPFWKKKSPLLLIKEMKGRHVSRAQKANSLYKDTGTGTPHPPSPGSGR